MEIMTRFVLKNESCYAFTDYKIHVEIRTVVPVIVTRVPNILRSEGHKDINESRKIILVS
jgi:hypothetical protein